MLTPHQADVVRTWLGDHGVDPVDMRGERLATGSSHDVWRITVEDRSWVFRWRRRTALGMTKNHPREALLWRHAAAHDLAPPLLDVSADGSTWVCHHVAPARPPVTPAELGGLMRRIHQLPSVSAPLDLRAQLACYREAAEGRHPGDREANPYPFDTGQAPAVDIARLQAGIDRLCDTPSVVCHNDLRADNVLGPPGARRVIDWEYAAMGPPLFDAASTLASLPDSARDAFLVAAFPDGVDTALLTIAEQVYAGIEQLWAAARHHEAGEP